MAWDDTKIMNDDFASADWNSMVTDQKTRAVRTSDAGVPSSAPSSVGDFYVDTTSNKMYVAMGTSTVSDWKKVITQ